jgi:hypothetical protein
VNQFARYFKGEIGSLECYAQYCFFFFYFFPPSFVARTTFEQIYSPSSHSPPTFWAAGQVSATAIKTQLRLLMESFPKLIGDGLSLPD